jgi:hypothetical protein
VGPTRSAEAKLADLEYPVSPETEPARDDRTHRSQPRLFISHRHADRPIADAVCNFVTYQSGKRVVVHQSSSSDAQAPKIGRNVNRELTTWLWKTDVLILIYTGRDRDWDYCMWECGVATHSESDDTSVIVLQCGRDLPRVFADQVAVDVRDFEKVRRFVNDFLTDPSFFPGRNEAVTRFQPNDPNIERAAQDLYDDLKTVLPPDEEGQEETWHAVPFVRLGLTAGQVRQIADEENDDRARTMTAKLLLDATVLIGDREAAALFGRPTLPADESFGHVFKRTVRKDQPPTWLKSLADQVTRAAQWSYPAVHWSPMRSANANDQTWYCPVLTHVRRSPNKAMEFDVHFQRFAGSAGTGSISIPVPEALAREADSNSMMAEVVNGAAEATPETG